MKILIVDDEYLVRQDLLSLIDWNAEGFSEVIEAKNGLNGYELFKLHKPSIVITDIKMPLLDGIKMTEKILKDAPQTKIIVLTAYEEFDYARSALKLGVRHFLLKHEIDSKILKDTIKELVYEISNIDHSKLIQKDWLFQKILFEFQENTEEIKNLIINIYPPVNEKTYYALICLAFNNIGIKRHKAGEEGWKNIVNNFKDYLKFINLENAKVECVLQNDDCFILVITTKPIDSKAEQYNIMNQTCSEISSKIVKELNEEVSIFCGRIETGLLLLRESYIKIRKIMERKFAKPNRAIVLYNETPENPKGEFDIQKYYASIHDVFSRENHKEIIEFLDKTYIEILPAYGDLDLMNKFTRNIVYELKLITQMDWAKGVDKIDDANEILEFVSMYDNVYDINTQLKNSTNLIFEARNWYETCRYSILVKRALAYIHENYQKDISLGSLADDLEVSRVYLSQIFKKETGINFIDYITEYRIEKAKRLISTGRYKINEISEKVGFNNLQYFSMKFKSIVGIPPIKYKNL